MYTRMKQYILLSLFVPFLFSCAEDKIETYSGKQYLYFSELMDTKEGNKEAVEISFNNYPLDDELSVEISLGLVGDPFSVPTPYKVSVVTDKTTALAENYELPVAPMFKPNVAEDVLSLKLIKTERLKEDVTLMLKIEPNEYIAGSVKQYETIKVIFNAVESKPLWWTKTVDKNYLGTYSPKKYRALVQYGGEEAKDFGNLNAAQKRLCALRLKQAIEDNNLLEENGQPMTVPVN